METKKHLFHWCRVPIGNSVPMFRWAKTLSLVLCLLTLCVPKASANDLKVTVSKGTITPEEPYLIFLVMIRDENGYNSYFNNCNPELYVDGTFITNDDDFRYEMRAYGDSSVPNSWRGIDGFHCKWYNGEKGIYVCSHNPYGSSDRYYVEYYVFFSNVEVGKTHSFAVRGSWTNDQDNKGWITRTAYSDPTPDPFAALGSFTRKSDGYVTYSGNLNSKSNYSTVASFYDSQQTTWRNGSGSLKSQTYGSSYSQMTLDIPVGSNINDKVIYSQFGLKRNSQYSIGGWYWTPVIYKNFSSKTVTGFSSPKELTATGELWDKTIRLRWEVEEDNKDKNGTWTIYRRKEGLAPENRVAICEGLEYAKRQYLDESPEYDTDYIYEVVFVPSNFISTTVASDLMASKVVKLERAFNFTDLTPTPQENSVVLSWTHDTPSDGSQLTFKVWRCLNKRSLKKADGTYDKEKVLAELGSDPIKTVTAAAQGNTTTCEDNSLANNMTLYLYVISVEAMGDVWYSDVIGPTTLSGHTEILNMTANRGTYSNVVKLQWDVKQVGTEATRYIVFRRLLGSENDEDYQQVHVVSGTEASYYFEDNTAQPGQFYQYRVVAQGKFLDADTNETAYEDMSGKEADGFCQSRGTISGRITYGTGTAVPDARVLLSKNNEEGDAVNQFYSMRVNPKGGIKWAPSGSGGRSIFQGKPFTFQLYVRPETVTADGSMLIDGGGDFAVMLKPATEADKSEIYLKVGDGEAKATGMTLQNDSFTQVCVSNNGGTEWTVRTIDVKKEMTSTTLTAEATIAWSGNEVVFGGDRAFTTDHSFVGYLDDIRLWSKALTDDDVLGNYDRLLIGTESGLKLYWPMDEGVMGLPFAYDYSKTSGVANENHGRKQPNTTFSPIIPEDEQLRLYGKTDGEGNYVIRGVPFMGEGTSYLVRPTLGVHEFSPKYQTRFVNTEALTHNSVDFEDVSSFPASGVVYFDGTTIPVKDAMIYVDGTLASKDGEAIKTDSKGEFTVSVPIGDHFIQVKKQGHTFVDNGRYPKDPNGVGTRFTFESEVTNLGFYDNTRVTVAGRVVGGDIETEKLLGLGLSKANIGQARLTLTYANSDQSFINAKKTTIGSAVSYNESDEQRDFNPSTARVNSTAYVAAGKNKVTILTDPKTGEWAAELLPLRYTIESIVIPSAEEDYTFSSLPDIDATDPNSKVTDSLSVDSVFKYVASAKIEYKSQSIIDLTEHANGAFGEQSIKVSGLDGNEVDVPLYAVDEEGKVSYTFDYPVYQEMGKYTYKLHAYERYVNKDGGTNSTQWVVDRVPLSGKTVKIENQYATGVAVSTADGSIVESNEKEFDLDDEGKLTYQFQAGLPNIQAPYTRGISIALDDNGTMVPWEGNETFKAVVLGSISTGTNFTTQAPDEVIMVLRDPPGSNSSATFSKGHTFTEEGTLNVVCSIEGAETATTTTAAKLKVVNGVGVAVVTETNTSQTTGLGTEFINSVGTNNSWTHATTITEDISTSDDPEWVGAPADRFYGVSKNTLFGTCHIVKVKKNEVTGQYELGMEDGISIGEEFKTVFVFSQYQIENRVIPEYEGLRDSLLHTVLDPTNVARPASGEDPIYVTTLDSEDERFGSNNHDKDVWGTKAIDISKGCDDDGIFRGPSYWIILPDDWQEPGKVYQDMVQFYNEQIKGWKNELAANERAKVDAMKQPDKYLIDNFSIDGSGSYTQTTSTSDTDAHSFEFTEEIKIAYCSQFSTELNGNGTSFTMSGNTHESGTTTYVNTDEFTSGFSFTLAENGDDDYLSIDVFNAPDNYGPIFVTQGGATSCPYEDKVVTKYYKPGTVIGAKTTQIEKPEIEAKTQLITGVPAGGVGTFQVYIRNNSDTSEDGMYNLNVVPSSNPHGLVVKMDGLNITTGRAIMVKAGDPMLKTFTVEQSDPDVLTYENIKIRISSQCQPNNTGVYPEIADTTTISVYFQPTCSDIHLASTHSVVNTETETMQTLSISGYNYSMASLAGVRLEYKGEYDADFHTLQEYRKDEKVVAKDENLLLLPALTGTDKLNYTIDLRGDDFTDKTYVFRAVTICMQGGVEVNNESEEIEIVRDMNRPQLIATPSPASGILTGGDDLLITFNEDIQGGILSKPNNFDIVGVLNESEVAHDVALSLTGMNAAKTEAPMDLSGKSFSANMWVNYQTDGTLLTHGTADNNFTVAIEDGKLAVSVAGQKATSQQSIPADKWIYLNVSYEAGEADGSTPTVSAGYAQDASTVALLSSVVTKTYEGNGIISVGGNNLTAKVQELAIWKGVRSMSDAQADMYTTKSQFTSGLMGYWQLNEGHGNMATDKARSRHITLPNENAWWINGANYALMLDGTQAATVNIGSLNTTSAEDYLVEAWFKADEQQNGAASLLGTQKMDLRLNAQGKMELEAMGTTTAVGDKDLRDGLWHHVAVNVLKSTNGNASIYIDGMQCRQIAASAMPILSGNKLMLGSRQIEGTTHYDQMLKGAIDEVRIWKGRRTADVIKDRMYARVKADEAGLVAYYPMEQNEVDLVTNQIVATGTMDDAVTAGKENEPTLSLTFYNTVGTAVSAQTSALSAKNTAALKQAPKMDNVQFDFVASERQIKVNLNEQASKIEGCNIYLTAKNVKDRNGNKANAITWSVYVQQNNMKWQESEVDVTKTGAEEATFTATIENRGSESEVWSLSGMPAWLSTNTEGGTLMPLTSTELTFTVAKSLPIGTYETTVYLTGSQEIATPLNVTVTSEGQVPDWSVNPRDFENSMNVIGQVKLDGQLMNDEKDMLAAFIGDECRGVAHLQYKPRYDGYFVTMDIYDNGEGDEKKEVTFRAYDASTGTVYPAVEPDQPIKFEALTLVGKYDEPIVFNVLDKVEQSTELKAGWNWLSLNVTKDKMDVETLFENIAEDVDIVKSQYGGWLMYEEGEWNGGLTADLTNDQMYAVRMLNDRTLRIIGNRVSPKDCPITVYPGWNWVGYYGRQVASVDDAMTGMQPVNGDILKAQSGVAYFDETEWAGSIELMEPGKGYMVNVKTQRTFGYPKASVAGARGLSVEEGDLVTADHGAFTPVDFRNYASNAIMAAKIVAAGKPVTNAELGVFADGECRAAAMTNEKGVAYLTIPGDDAAVLTFKVAVGDKEADAAESVTYEVDAVYGSPKHPFVIDLSGATEIEIVESDDERVEIYDLQGRKVTSEKARLNKGVYIVNGRKQVVK